ncbi:MAG: MBL fold metallo-hydrolase [Treponema sp.]|nr:MBL fold metallo-hydrolase [Candidatus Treponema equi]
MKIHCIQTGIFRVNTYIVPIGEDRCFIVDPAACSFTRDTEKFSAYLDSLKLVPAAVVLTHGHFDHVSGLKYLREKYPEIPVYIHKEDSPMIGSNSGEVQGPSLEAMGYDAFIPSVSELPEPTDFLADGKTLFDTWTVIHTPGHTKGSCCLLNKKDGLLISGDTVFYGTWGRTDLPGGSEVQMMQSLSRIRENVSGATLVYPGHDYFGFELREGM